jgi:hypothetical protein
MIRVRRTGNESSSKIERGLEEWGWLERMGVAREVQPGEPLYVESCSIRLCIAVISFIFWAKHYKLADRTSLAREHNLLPQDHFTWGILWPH